MGIPFSFLAVGTVELGLGARPICLRARNRLCWAIQKGWSNLALGYWRRQGTNNWISTASSWTLSTPTAYFALLDWYFQHSHSLFWLLGNAEALVVRRPSQTCGHRSQLSYTQTHIPTNKRFSYTINLCLTVRRLRTATVTWGSTFTQHVLYSRWHHYTH